MAKDQTGQVDDARNMEGLGLTGHALMFPLAVLACDYNRKRGHPLIAALFGVVAVVDAIAIVEHLRSLNDGTTVTTNGCE